MGLRRIVDAARHTSAALGRAAFALTMLSGCPPVSTPTCPSGQDYQLIGYEYAGQFHNEGVIPSALDFVGSSPTKQQVSCYTGNNSAHFFVQYVVNVDPSGPITTLGGPVVDESSPTLPAPIILPMRIATACKQPDMQSFPDPNAIKAIFFDGNRKYVSSFAITPNFFDDTGVFTNTAVFVCIFNNTNFPAYAYVDVYNRYEGCVTPDAARKVWLADDVVPPGFNPGCAPLSIPNPGCSGDGNSFGNFTFCSSCGGGSYTETTTKEFFNVCYLDARQEAEDQAANCDVSDGACP